MQYERTFRLSAAHFNSGRSYQTAWKLASLESVHLTQEDLLRAFLDIHGHNFKIVVMVCTDVLQYDGWLIDDVALAKHVMRWDGINLSMHPDFFNDKLRATTELMAHKLYQQLNHAFPDKISFVRVFETDDIFAEAP